MYEGQTRKELIEELIELRREVDHYKGLEREHRKTEADLRAINQQLQGILDHSPNAIYVKDTSGNILYSNPYNNTYLHVKNEEIVGKTPYHFFPKEVADRFIMQDQEVIRTRKPLTDELIRQVGTEVGTFIITKFPLLDEKGEPYAVCGITTDITELKRTEEKLRASLTEKEVLLRELYHRTKNNMQVICGLLTLQSADIEDERIRRKFRETESRIKSMALVHEKLYQSEDLTKINLKSYIDELTISLMQTYQVQPDRISLKQDTENFFVTIDTAVPCGLIITELVSNALKYAFPGYISGEIRIGLHPTSDGGIELTVADNGVGMPRDFDLKKADSIGLRTVVTIGEHQLQGSVTLTSAHGTEFIIRFREPNYKKRI